jgi:hypothetical protein
MKTPARVLLSLIAAIGLIAALRGLLRLLGTSSITDDHIRSITRVEHSTTMLVGGAVAYFAWRTASRLQYDR